MANMEQAVEARLAQDKELIQAVTQQEMRKMALRNKIATLRNNRSVFTEDNQATDSKGRPIPGQRKTQNYYVTQEQVLQRVMKRLQFPDELKELAEAEKAEQAEQGDHGDQGETADSPESSDSECILDDDEQEVNLAELPTIFKAQPREPRAEPIVVQSAQPSAAPQKALTKHLDEIDLALAEIAKQERKAKAKQQQRAKNKPRRKKM